MKLTPKTQVNGNPTGKKLYVVTTIDVDDYDDTMTELWRADDDDELETLVRDRYAGDDETRNDAFDVDWGYVILPFELGNVEHTAGLKAIIDSETGEVKSRGLDDHMVEYLMVQKKWNQYPNIKVVDDSEIKE